MTLTKDLKFIRQNFVLKNEISVLKVTFNPFKLSVLKMGHRQIVQTQMRRRMMRRLIWVFTICLKDTSNYVKIDKIDLTP